MAIEKVVSADPASLSVPVGAMLPDHGGHRRAVHAEKRQQRLVEILFLVIREILEARHEIDAQEMAQAPQGFCEAVGVGGVLEGIEAGIVLEQAVEDVGRLPRGAAR